VLDPANNESFNDIIIGANINQLCGGPKFFTISPSLIKGFYKHIAFPVGLW